MKDNLARGYQPQSEQPIPLRPKPPRTTTRAAPPPPPPDSLDATAKEVWRRTVNLMSAMTKFATGENVLATADLDALSIYCTAYSRWQEAEKHIAEDGAVIRLPSGYHGVNPFVGISKSAATQVRQYGEAFGLTPASRAKLAIRFEEKEAASAH